MLVGTREEGATSDPIPPDSELESGFDPSKAHEAHQADVVRGVLTTVDAGDDIEAADIADEATG